MIWWKREPKPYVPDAWDIRMERRIRTEREAWEAKRESEKRHRELKEATKSPTPVPTPINYD